MKTTIEINGYEVVIEETEGSISVSALKEGETVEEFTLELSEEGDELKSFGEEEDDFDGEDLGDDEDEMPTDDEDGEFEEETEDGDFEEDGFEEEEETESKLESFNSFISRKRK
jgi:hypothetical protein